jgi:hypothetical protein
LSISARNAARRVVLPYLSNPTLAKLICFIAFLLAQHPQRKQEAG